MTFQEPEKVLSRFSRLLRSHGCAALTPAYAISDSQTREHVLGESNVVVTHNTESDYFQRLLQVEGVSEAWNSYTNVTDDTKFPKKLATGTAPLHGFRHYLLQDAIYLEHYVRGRLEAIAAPSSKAFTAQLMKFADEIKTGLADSADMRATCQDQLGIPESIVDDEWNNHASQELRSSVEFYRKVIQGTADDEYTKPTNPWLDIHFALLPCIKGYYTIATSVQDPLKNTLYYPLWIAANQDVDYVEDYEAFINENIGKPSDDDWKHWGRLFLQACKNEEAFFDLLLENDVVYGTVREGHEILIVPHGDTTEYLATDGDDRVVLKDQEEKWQWTNAKDGYTIWTGGTDTRYLTADVANKTVFMTGDALQATKWDINFTTKDGSYELFVAGYMNLALNLDRKTKKVNLEENTLETGENTILVRARTRWDFKTVLDLQDREMLC